MPSDVTPVDAFTSPVRKPLAGELVTQASVEQFVQPLTDQSFNNKGRLDDLALYVTPAAIALTHVDTTAGAMAPAHVQITGPGTTSRYWLLRSFGDPGVQSQRWYIDNLGDESSLVITTNAVWDAVAGNWTKPAAGSPSSKIVFGTNGPIAQHGISIRSVAAGQASPFSDGAWSSHAGLFYDASEDISHLQLEGNLPTGESPETNSLYGNSVCKCWGNITVTSGVIVVNDGFNINASSTVLNGTTALRVAFRNALNNSNYAPVGMTFASTLTDQQVCSARSTGTFDLQYVNTSTQAAVDLTATSRVFQFAIFGTDS